MTGEPLPLDGWTKSSYSGAGNCVQVAASGDNIAVRDSKAPDGPVLLFTRQEIEAFFKGVEDGEFDQFL